MAKQSRATHTWPMLGILRSHTWQLLGWISHCHEAFVEQGGEAGNPRWRLLKRAGCSQLIQREVEKRARRRI